MTLDEFECAALHCLLAECYFAPPLHALVWPLLTNAALRPWHTHTLPLARVLSAMQLHPGTPGALAQDSARAMAAIHDLSMRRHRLRDTRAGCAAFQVLEWASWAPDRSELSYLPGRDLRRLITFHAEQIRGGVRHAGAPHGAIEPVACLQAL